MTLQKARHCVFDLHYHIVFAVKYRKSLLNAATVDVIVRTAEGISERYGIEFEALGADKDHIHILCSAHPKVSIGSIVRIFKSITAREIFRTFPRLKKDELWGGEFWSDGYYAATVGEGGNWNVVLRYVLNQGNNPEESGLRQLPLWAGQPPSAS